MNTSITPEIRTIIEATHYRPAVSVIMPFEPKMNVKVTLSHALKLAATKIEKELAEKYPGEIARVVTQKLHNIIKNLNYDTHKKTVAIFVSPVFEKVVYLDLPVEEKIIVDESFEVRDLVYCMKQSHKFLILLLSANGSKMYLGDSNICIRILPGQAGPFNPYSGEAPQRVGNFSDIPARKEILMHKFLQQVEDSLDIILKTYDLPLFVLGTDRIMGHFKKITRHGGAVIDYVHGNYEETSLDELQKILEPFIAYWQKARQKDLMNRLEEAGSKNKLVFGIRKVWEEAMSQKGQLLVVEKNYMYPANDENPEKFVDPAEPYNHFPGIKDAVDDIIEKVLENGGDIEFTEEGLLSRFQHIALVKYY